MSKSWLATVALLALAVPALAQRGTVRVLASNGVTGALEEIKAQCEQAVGHPLAIEYNTTANLKQKMEAGEPFDVTLLTAEAVDELNKEGKLAPGTRTAIARVGIGIGVRQGTPKADTSTPEAVKRVLSNAKSITYTPNGASAQWAFKMFDGLGIREQLQPKFAPLPGAELTTGSVAEGKNEMVVTLISEILTAKGVELLGAVPSQFQHYVEFAAGAGAQAADAGAAGKVLQCFTGPEAKRALKAKGMETE